MRIYKVGVHKLGRDQLYFGETFDDAPTRVGGISEALPGATYGHTAARFTREVDDVEKLRIRSPHPEEELPLIQNVNIDMERGLLYRCLCRTMADTKKPTAMEADTVGILHFPYKRQKLETPLSDVESKHALPEASSMNPTMEADLAHEHSVVSSDERAKETPI